MEPIKKSQLKSIIASACVVHLDTGETQALSTKGESYCHFIKPTIIGDYRIIFRLDWSELDTGGHPTLDADFYDIETNKKLPNKGDRYAAHHTNAKNSTTRTYEWEFRETKRPFKVMICWIIDEKEPVQMSDSASCEVFRNGLRMDV